MISIQHIRKTFHANTANEIKALHDINIDIPEKEFLVIVGSNGSGKSTLLNILAGSVMADEGKILLDNNNLTRLKEHQRSKWIARVFQNPLLGTASELSILDNFRLASLRCVTKNLRIGTGENFRKIVREKIATLNLGLENKIDQPIGTLSGGQRQGITLLMAVMAETKVLLLDEPSAALDPKTATILMTLADKIIHEFQLTAILITHQMKDILKYGNRVIQLREGQVVRDISGKGKQDLQLNDVFAWFGE